VIDGPFAETKELIAGFWIVASEIDGRGGRVGLSAAPAPLTRPTARSRFARVFEMEEFGAEFTPELREQEERLRAQIDNQTKS